MFNGRYQDFSIPLGSAGAKYGFIQTGRTYLALLLLETPGIPPVFFLTFYYFYAKMVVSGWS